VATGSYNDDTNSNYGFVRATDGTITILGVPGARRQSLWRHHLVQHQ
jgi:hypothetical protein